MMEEKLLGIINEVLMDKGESMLQKLEGKISLRKDLRFDSMDLAFLTAKLDEECGVDIFADGIIDTVDEVLEKLG